MRDYRVISVCIPYEGQQISDSFAGRWYLRKHVFKPDKRRKTWKGSCIILFPEIFAVCLKAYRFTEGSVWDESCCCIKTAWDKKEE